MLQSMGPHRIGHDLVTERYLTSDSKCEDLIKSWRWLKQSSGSQIWLMFFQDLPPDILIYKADRHEKYVFLSSPGESDKPDVRNGFVSLLDNLWCPFQDKAPSSPWETAKGNRTSSWWALYQLKPELGALWVLKAVYLEIEVGLLFCLWASKHVLYTHMYPNTSKIYIYIYIYIHTHTHTQTYIYINQRQLSTWRLENAIMPFPKKSHYFSLLENTICGEYTLEETYQHL